MSEHAIVVGKVSFAAGLILAEAEWLRAENRRLRENQLTPDEARTLADWLVTFPEWVGRNVEETIDSPEWHVLDKLRRIAGETSET